jgi:hypothetical protein
MSSPREVRPDSLTNARLNLSQTVEGCARQTMEVTARSLWKQTKARGCARENIEKEDQKIDKG